VATEWWRGQRQNRFRRSAKHQLYADPRSTALESRVRFPTRLVSVRIPLRVRESGGRIWIPLPDGRPDVETWRPQGTGSIRSIGGTFDPQALRNSGVQSTNQPYDSSISAGWRGGNVNVVNEIGNRPFTATYLNSSANNNIQRQRFFLNAQGDLDLR